MQDEKDKTRWKMKRTENNGRRRMENEKNTTMEEMRGWTKR
jgi:hypothetical protein